MTDDAAATALGAFRGDSCRFLGAIDLRTGHEEASGPLAGYLVGIMRDAENVMPTDDLGICPDPVVTVHVLARTVGGLYIPRRKPHSDWPRLFQKAFFVDEPGLRFPNKDEAPWHSLLRELS